MVFFVVVPIVFGFFANFFIPYHIGSKDVAFPRLNNLGFWLFPAGYVLVAKPAFLRPSITKYFDKPSFFYKLSSKPYSYSNLSNINENNPLKSTTNIGLKKNTNKINVFLEDNFQILNTPLSFFKKELLNHNFLNY
jgi:hypothetical protein